MKCARIGTALAALFLLACGGGGGGGSGIVVGNLLVQGKVATTFGSPAPNLPLWVAGRGPFITDINGMFTVAQVPVPYEVILLDADEVIVQVWDGLTRADPVFTLPLSGPGGGLPPTATVEGTLTGGVGWPVPTTHETTVVAALRRSVAGSGGSADPVTGLYSESPSWFEQVPTAEGRVVGYQFLKDPDGSPQTYTGWGELPLTLSSGETLVGQNIALGPVATTSASGSLDLPPGLLPVLYAPFLRYPTGEVVILESRTSFDAMFAEMIPVVPGTSRGLLSLSFSSGSAAVYSVLRDLAAPALGLIWSLPEVTDHVLPFDGITGVGYDTVFTVTPSIGDRVLTVSFSPVSAPPSSPRIDVHTTRTTFTIPDLRPLGLGIPSGAEYEWSVTTISPVFSLDDAAVPTDNVLTLPFPVGLNQADITSGGQRTFTFGN